MISQYGRKMNNIIEDILLLASMRQMDKVEMSSLNMAEIITEARGRLEDLIEKRQAEIIPSLQESWPTAWGYAPWVEEVWANYLSNAIKYGGQPPRVELGATVQPDGQVRFWVRDNGPGLTPGEQARLFAPFTQLHQVRAEGHGLGLSIVQRIVEKLGGQAGVESQGVPGRKHVLVYTARRTTLINYAPPLSPTFETDRRHSGRNQAIPGHKRRSPTDREPQRRGSPRIPRLCRKQP
jgi:signal transduction histidine kinase